MEEVNDLWLQIESKKPFLALIVKAKASILILPKFQPKMWYFFLLMILNQLIGQPQIKFARLWFCEDTHHSSILKQAIKKGIQKSNNWNLTSKLFEDNSNNEKISLLGLCLHTKKGTQLTSFHIHSFVVFHTDLQKRTIVTYTLTSRNHMMSNMQGQLLQLMQLIQYRHVSLFSTSSPITLLEKIFAQKISLSMAIRQWDLM